jgi:hypothetical protein
MANKVDYHIVDSLTIQFMLQPHSTTWVGGGVIGPTYLDRFTFIQSSDTTLLTYQELSRNIKKSGGVFPPYHFTYYINRK